MAAQKLRARIRPIGSYKAHFRLFSFPEEGREVLVDPAATKDVDEKGRPLVLTQASWDYIRQASGTRLVIEPLDDYASRGQADSLRAEVGELRERLEAAEREIEARGVELERAHGTIRQHEEFREQTTVELKALRTFKEKAEKKAGA